MTLQRVRTGSTQGATNSGKSSRVGPMLPHPNAFRFVEHPEARTFPRTTPEAIAAMSRRQGIRVLTDWAAFLLERNGYDFNTVTIGKPMRAPYRYAETALYMLGVGTGFEFNDLDEVLNEQTRLERPYRAFLTPIGMCSSGDLIAQITAGPKVGSIVMIDHNVHLYLGPEEFGKRAGRTLSHPDTGTVIDWLVSHGMLIPLADSLRGFFDLLIVEAENDGTVINVQISYAD
jgi:hypothetical protein